MSKAITDLPIEAGLFTEQSARGAKGRWKDADKVRFRYGLPEKIGGWERLQSQFRGLARRIHDWASLDGRLWTAIGTDKKLYLWQDGKLFDITPLRLEAALTNPFATTNNSTTVVVSHLNGHGAQVGDFVRFENASLVGSVNLNGEFEVTKIVSYEEYEIETEAAAAASEIGGGAVTAKYDISIGGADTSVGFGWGVGGWGMSTWGTPRQRSSQLIPARTWSLDNWGEDLIANPNSKAIYWWDRTLGPESRAVLLEGAPERAIYSIISQRDRQLFALGCTDYVSGAFDPLLIRYCARENFNEWIPSDTNTAGDLRLFRGSRIVTGIRTRAEMLVFTDVSVHSINYLGEGLMYGINVVGENVSILGPNAAVAVDHRVLFMGESDFFMYDGVLRVLPCPVRSHVFSRIDRQQKVKVYAGLNREFNEVWWFYPVAQEIEPEPQLAPDPLAMDAQVSGWATEAFYDERTEKYYIGGQYGSYSTSEDGIEWTPAAVPAWTGGGSNVLLRFLYGNGYYLAVGQTRMSRSSDGATWNEITNLPVAGMGTSAAFGNGAFVVRRHNSLFLTQTIYTSNDSMAWTLATGYETLNSIFEITFLNGLFIVSASGATSGIMLLTSPNGSAWTEIPSTIPAIDGWFHNFIYEDGQYIAITSNGAVLTSTNLADWTLQWQSPSGSSATIIGIEKLGKYYVVVQSLSNDNGARVFYSEDLTEWFSTDALGVVGVHRTSKANGHVYFSQSSDPFTLFRLEGPETPEQPASEITDYVCLNIEEGTWTYGTMPRTAWTDASPVLDKPYAASVDSYLYKHEVGVDADGLAMNAFIESFDMEIPQSGEMFSHIDQLIPDFLTLEGSVDITLKGKKYPHQPDYQEKGPYLVDPTVQKVSTRIRARQVSLRIESDEMGDKWRLATIRGRLRAHGKRA